MNLKKTAFFAMALAFCSCVQEAENQFQKGTNSFLAESSEVLDTKVTLDNDGTPLWQAGDKVSVWGGVFDNAIYTADYSGDRTSLSTVVEGEIAADEVYYAMSPYVEGASFADGKFTLELPAEQKVPATRLSLSPAVATTTGTAKTFGFRNACGLMSFSITQEGVSKAMIYSNGQEKIAGTLTIDCTDFENPVATLEGTSSVITLTPEEGETFATGVYYLALPPMTLEMGVSISLFKADGSLVSKHKSSAFEIKRSNLYESGNVDAAGFSTNYVIKTAQQLQGFLSIAGLLPEGTTASLANDIDLAGITLDGASHWYGTFDGNGYSLKNWNCVEALFKTNHGTVTELNIDASCSISLAKENSIAFIALTNRGTISSCVNNASLTETYSDNMSKLFGFITANNYGKLISCTNKGNLTLTNAGTSGDYRLGGLAGQMKFVAPESSEVTSVLPEITSCTNEGTIQFTSEKGNASNVGAIYLGGICAMTEPHLAANVLNQGTLSECINKGTVTVEVKGKYVAPVNVGGVIGYLEGDIVNCTNETAGSVSFIAPYVDDTYYVQRPSVGGVAGAICYGATKCVNKAAVSVQFTGLSSDSSEIVGFGASAFPAAGGVFGMAGLPTADSSKILDDCDNSGALTFTSSMTKTSKGDRRIHYFGGVVGYSTVLMKNCTNSGTLTVNSKTNKIYLGGVAGINQFNMENCDNSGNITFDFVNTAANGNQGLGGLYLGGITGSMSTPSAYITYTNCENTAEFIKILNGHGTTPVTVGGILGDQSDKGCKMTSVKNTADIICSVPGKVVIGGISAKCYAGFTSVECSGDITVTGCLNESSIGGFMGDMAVNGKSFDGCSYVGNINVTGADDASVYSGLLAGQNSNTKSFWGFANTNIIGGTITSTDKNNTAFIIGKAADKARAQTLTLKNIQVKAGTSVNGTPVTADNCVDLAIANKGTNASVTKDTTITFE